MSKSTQSTSGEDEAAQARAEDYATLFAALGVTVEPEAMRLALTHRSYAYEHGGLPHNERLEFLGDTVLGLSVTEYLYRTYPERPEGELAKIRASLVNMYTLAEVARELGEGGLGAHIRLGKGEELTGGRDKDSILADTTEAVFGAIYLEHGLEPARKVVLEQLGERLDSAPRLGAALDWKTSLQEVCAAKHLSAPRYRIAESGPDHAKEFTATVVVDGEDRGSGTGRSKKEAEQRAAERAYAELSGKGAEK
ncbi:ribonuclease III [Dietzia sp.]|uniref:ribonuclease III n=1 Tax=Dietzia sp. TaxID=1871616 RepID=UPI002FD9CFC2